MRDKRIWDIIRLVAYWMLFEQWGRISAISIAVLAGMFIGRGSVSPRPASPPPQSESINSQEKPASKPVRQEITVYTTRTGKKYHTAYCASLRSSSIPMPLDRARLLYEPCSRCSPPR